MGEEGGASFELDFLDPLANEPDLHMIRKCDNIQFTGFQRLLVGGLIDTVIQDHFTLLRIDIDNCRQDIAVAVTKIAGHQGTVPHHGPQDRQNPGL